MNPGRFAEVERVCQAALDQPADTRAAFVAQACGDDEELRAEVEALLAGESRAQGLMEAPVAAVGPLPGADGFPALAAGTRLGPYEVEALADQGGMGQVYRARDTRLGRTVAIKMLPPTFDADPDRRARFRREAKTIAGLNHASICALYDVGDYAGTTPGDPALYLVMEYITGETLAQRLRKGPLPVEEALAIATQIAEALAAAHREGVIHRDVKPGNVMLTKSGAKLLDFGLAKLRSGSVLGAAAGTSSPDARATATVPGAVLGTVPYMAPEQLEGREADARSDIFAFGAVLYEMLTGQRAFAGDSQVGVMAAILEREPSSLSAVRSRGGAGLERAVRRCLAKDPNDRWQSALDLANHLRWLREDTGTQAVPTGQVRSRQWRAVVVPALLIVGTAGATWGLAARFMSSAPAPWTVHSVVDVAPLEVAGGNSAAQAYFGRSRLTALALSPDGRTIVFVGRQGRQQQLYRRTLASEQVVPFAGTEGAGGPFYSPDGQWVAFWSGTGAQQGASLLRVPVSGGPPTRLCSAASAGFLPLGASWGDDGRIVFAESQHGLFRVAADGSQPDCEAERLRVAGDEQSRVSMPQVLPGGRFLLFTRSPLGLMPDPELDCVVVQPLPSGEARTLVRSAADARYASSGHLLYTRWGRLYAAPFDVGQAKITGSEIAVIDDVLQSKNGTSPWVFDTGAAHLAVSSTGTVAYLTGGVVPEQSDQMLAWSDLAGKRESLAAPAAGYGYQQLSRDGRRVLYRQVDRARSFLWTLETESGRTRKLTTVGSATAPLWSADGKRIVMWFEDGNGTGGLAWIPEDGSAPPQFLTRSADPQLPCQWMPDGRTLIVLSVPRSRPNEVNLVSFSPDGTAAVRRWRDTRVPFGTDVNEPALSPDGRWLAYSSTEARSPEVYVDSFETPGSLTKVSINGGRSPVWAPDSRTLYYTEQQSSGLQRMMSVEVRGTPTLSASGPQPLFEGRWLNRSNTGSVRLTADGRRFLLVVPVNPEPRPFPAPTQIHLIQNWFEELKAKVR